MNGRLVGQLPLQTPLRKMAGMYTLEVRREGYYSSSRTIHLVGGTLTRESLQLSANVSQAAPTLLPPAGPVVAMSSASGYAPGHMPDSERRGSNWLGWTFATLSANSAAATLVAWRVREGHVDKWNDNTQCQGNGQTREQICSDSIDDGERAETLMMLGLAATGVFASASVYWFFIDPPQASAFSAAQLKCGVGPLSLECFGQF